MIKSAFKVFTKNIWNTFAIIGFVSLGIFVGVFVTLPVINNLFFNSYNHVLSAATNLGQGFSVDAFMRSFNSQIQALDWMNPIRTIRILFDKNGLYNIFIKALQSGNLKPEQIIMMNDIILNSINTLYSGLKSEASIFLSCVGVASIIGYIGTKIVVQIRSTYNHHFVRFFGSFIMNLGIIALFYFLIILSLVSVGGVGLFFSLLAIYIMVLLLTFLSAIIWYKNKDTKFFELFNIKTNLSLLLSCLLLFTISTIIVILLFLFSDVIAILISIPLLLITTIITENIVINFVTGYQKKNSQVIENK